MHERFNMKKVLYKCGIGMCPEVLYECGPAGCPKVLYECGFGACPAAVYDCVVGGCPKAEEEKGIVTIFHPNEPEKGKVTMTAAEWNAMIKDAKPV